MRSCASSNEEKTEAMFLPVENKLFVQDIALITALKGGIMQYVKMKEGKHNTEMLYKLDYINASRWIIFQRKKDIVEINNLFLRYEHDDVNLAQAVKHYLSEIQTRNSSCCHASIPSQFKQMLEEIIRDLYPMLFFDEYTQRSYDETLQRLQEDLNCALSWIEKFRRELIDKEDIISRLERLLENEKSQVCKLRQASNCNYSNLPKSMIAEEQQRLTTNDFLQNSKLAEVLKTAQEQVRTLENEIAMLKAQNSTLSNVVSRKDTRIKRLQSQLRAFSPSPSQSAALRSSLKGFFQPGIGARHGDVQNSGAGLSNKNPGIQ